MKKRHRASGRRLLGGVVLLAFVGTCSCRQAPRYGSSTRPPSQPTQPGAVHKGSGAPQIRVAIAKNAVSIRVAGAPGRQLKSGAKTLEQTSELATLTIGSAAGTLTINGISAQERTLTITAPAPARLNVEGEDLTGHLQIQHLPSGLLAVAHLDLEEYLTGVLAGEVPFERWHAEALKAQAVTSRSYAYAQMRKNSAAGYDVESTVMSQVFKAGYRSNPILMEAVHATRGQIVTWQDAPLMAYFHSTCGGQTANATSVFPDAAPLGALSGAECRYCVESPHYRWRATFSKQLLAEKLKSLCAAAAPLGTLSQIEFCDVRGAQIGERTGRPARVTSVKVHHSKGTLQLQGNQFRLAVGPRELKSLLFEQVIDRGEVLEIAGGGFGHGAGLCQFGSQGLARAGRSYTEILGLYYPGGALTRIY